MSLTQRVFTERRRIVVPVLVFLTANVALLAVVVWLQRGVEGAEAARMQALSNLVAARQQEASVKDQRASMDRAEIELRKFYAEILPKNFASARDATNFWLGRVAANARLTYRAGQYDPEAVRDSRLVKFTGQVTLLGDYADIRRFLYEVETAQEFVIIEKVELSQPNATQGNAQLEVALTVATYFLADGEPGVVSR